MELLVAAVTGIVIEGSSVVIEKGKSLPCPEPVEGPASFPARNPSPKLAEATRMSVPDSTSWRNKGQSFKCGMPKGAMVGMLRYSIPSAAQKWLRLAGVSW